MSNTYRVRFVEWQAFALDVNASDEKRAIAIARAVREQLGDIDFEEIDGATEGWEAELVGAQPPKVASRKAGAR